MGNFKNIETEFVERTLHLISQYESMLHQYKFEEQYNHTLLVNCLLGLIVMPKEKTISFLPKEFLGKELKEKMGVSNSTFNTDITDLKDLIIALRHTIAHFDISFESDNQEEFLIDKIVFKDREKGENYVVASFIPSELLNFIRYYGGWLVNNIRQHNQKYYEQI